MFRKLLVFLAASSISLFLFLTVTASTLVLTFTPANVKLWLKDGDVYSHIVTDILKESKTLNKDQSGDTGGEKNPLDDPGIQAVANKTFTPVFLQTNVEKVIDGTEPWLKGETPKPTWQIDITAVKASFADNLGAYAKTRYNSLPVCTAPPESTDVLTVSCKPPGFNADAEIQKTVNELKTSPDFLEQTTFNSDTLTTGEGTDKQPLFTKLDKVPKVYKAARITPLVLGVLSLIGALIIIFLSTDRRKGIRRVAIAFYFTGGFLLLEYRGIIYGMDKATQKINGSGSEHQSLQTTGISLLQQVQKTLNHFVLIFAFSFLAVAVAMTIYLILTRQKTPKSTAVSDKEPIVDGLKEVEAAEDHEDTKEDHKTKDKPKEPLDAEPEDK